jgi:hypothetical protein
MAPQSGYTVRKIMDMGPLNSSVYCNENNNLIFC